MEINVLDKEKYKAIKKEDRQNISLIKSFDPLNINDEEIFNKLNSIENLKELLKICIEEEEEYAAFLIKGLLGEDVQKEACTFIGKEVEREEFFLTSILDVKGNEISPYLLGEVENIRARLRYSKSLFLCATFKNPPKIFREILGICYKANYTSLAAKIVKTIRRYNKDCKSIYEVFKEVYKCGVSLEVFLRMHLLNLSYEIEEEDLELILKNYYCEAIECYIEGEVHNFLEISKYFEKYVGDRVLEKAIYILNSGNVQGIKYIKEKLLFHEEYFHEIKTQCNLRDVHVRKAVVDILISYESKEGDKFLTAIKKRESSKTIKDKIEKYFLEKEELSKKDTQNIEDILSYINKKVKEIKVEDEEFLSNPPLLRWKNGKKCSKNVYKYILMSYQGDREIHENIGVVFLTSKLLKEDLVSFSNFLFSKWLDLGALSKDKWILSFVGENMPEALIYKMYKLISKFTNEKRYVIAGECVKSLILSQNTKALKYLRILECNSKNKKILTTIKEGFSNISNKRRIPLEEVYDLAVITDDMVVGKKYRLGNNEFKTIVMDGTVRLLDKEKKLYKQFPPSGDKEEVKSLNSSFRSFKYLLKKIIDSERARLLKAFQENRGWNGKDFCNIYKRNAILKEAIEPYVFGVFLETTLEREFISKDIRAIDIKDESTVKIIKIKE